MSTLPDGRYIDDAPYNPDKEARQIENPEFDAPARVLIWRRFKKHKLGLVSGMFLLLSYLLLPFAGFIAPYTASERDADHLYAPPQSISFMHEGEFIGPHVYKTTATADLENFRWTYLKDTSEPVKLEFFCNASEYRLFGLIKTTRHLFCAPGEATIFLFGSDRLGRDVFSRGIGFGSLAGYFGGRIDWGIQRLIEILRSLPELPLWLALSAAVPSHWGPVAVFFMISFILGLLDWPGLARAVRAKFLSLREEDYVQAAEMMGAKPSRVIRRHMIPNFSSHLIASAMLSIPAMILGETALSFLGLGLRAPAVSWGVMLNDAQSLASIEIYPWTAIPMIPIIIVVLPDLIIIRLDDQRPYGSVAIT